MTVDVCEHCGAYVFPKYNDVCLGCGFPLNEPSGDEPIYSQPLDTPQAEKLKSVSRPENIWLALLLVYVSVGLLMMLLVYIWK